MFRRLYIRIVGYLDIYTPSYRHQGGGHQENVCSQWEISEEDNGEVIVTNGYYHYRADTRKEAYQAVGEFLERELRVYREISLD